MTKTPPNLENVSKDASGLEAKNRERRRLPRLSLSGEQFRLSPQGKVFAVVDLSAHGMALRILDTEDLRVFAVAAVVQGQLNIRRQKFPVIAKVRNVRPDIVGCEFESLPPETVKALKQFLDPVALGQELRPIPAAGQSTLWYHGPSGTDLLLWRGTDGTYRRLTLYVQGFFIQWEDGAGVTTGLAKNSDERSEIQGIVRLETMMLEADAKPDHSKLGIAKSLLLSSNLPEDLKKWCVRHLEK